MIASKVEARQSTKDISTSYLKLDAALDYELLKDLYHDDVSFRDPTGEVFQGPSSGRRTEGVDAVVEMQRSWGLTGSEFEPTHSFYVGEYAVHRGTYRAQFGESQPWIDIPFFTVHRVVNGKIIERRDFGEYIQSFGLGDSFDESTTQTKIVADQYKKSYYAEDVDLHSALLADDAVFQDPTAQVLGPQAGQRIEGRDAIMKIRERTFANVSNFSMDVESSFYANHHAVYMGVISYTNAQGMTFHQPAISVVEVRDQHVVRQWDFVDYTVGPTR